MEGQKNENFLRHRLELQDPTADELKIKIRRKEKLTVPTDSSFIPPSSLRLVYTHFIYVFHATL
jgi:hypothetical protein